MDNKRTFISAQQIYKTARYALLGLILLAVMNTAMHLVRSDIYIMSGVFLAYVLSAGTKSMANTTGILAAGLSWSPTCSASSFPNGNAAGWSQPWSWCASTRCC